MKIMNQIGTIKNLNVGASHEEMISDWLSITIWGGEYKGLTSIGVYDEIEYFQHVDSKGLVINRNIDKGLPFEDNSIENIYSSHFIEHLTLTQAKFYFKEAFRVLKPNGVMRTVCPDISIWIKKVYEREDSFFFDQYKKQLDIDYWENVVYKEQESIISPIQVFNSMVYNWGHKWMWDYESLNRELTLSGFKTINQKALLEGDLYDLDRIENCLSPDKIENRNLESLYVECRKS